MTAQQPKFERDYTPVLSRSLSSAPSEPAELTRERAMKLAVDLLWEAFGGDGPGRGVSWIGFYGIEADAESMVLLERRDKPACSPIGMQGMCGRGYLDRRPILIDDVRTLGENYIACDPRDLSEIVVPLFENDGSCWGVLDGDSYETGAFSEADVEGMTALMERLGLSVPGDERPGVLRV
ncbi:MAG: GAF domain-containing protein [Phycisphaerales bacterium]|nr:MAG: GAF domain-containing protein [Phycisphaerales bacterium]